jgi:hypothetical protein
MCTQREGGREETLMRKRITLLVTALMLALTMSFGGVAFADPPGTTGKGDDPGTFTKDAKQQSHECVTGPGGSGKNEVNTNPQGKPTSAKCE